MLAMPCYASPCAFYTICNFSKIHIVLCVQKLQTGIIGPVLGQRTFLHAQLYGGIIKGYFEEIPWDKRFQLTAMFSSWLSFTMIMLNCIFVLWVGLYRQWKKFTMHPPNYVQNFHLQRWKNMNFISLTVRVPLFTTNQYHRACRDHKRLLKWSKWAKTDFTQGPPYPAPIAAVVFWLTLSHFSTDFLKKGVKPL